MSAADPRAGSSSDADARSPAGPEAPSSPEPDALARLAALVESVEGAGEVFILTHDNPDPDALASAAAVATLLERVPGLRARLAFGGIVGRAENRALLGEMRVEFERMEGLEIPTGVPVVLVDTQPRAGNNSLPAGRIVSAVIDHHPERPDTTTAEFADVRTEYGASASMAFEYLRAAGLEPEPWLATALFYAIQSETQDLGREASAVDIAASAYLYPRCDPAAIARIRHPRVPASYFRTLHAALAVARKHDRLIAISMGELPYPDMVAELADLFLQMSGVDWTFATGRYRDRLILSLRTYDGNAHAGSIIRGAIGDRGSAGGHGSLAGGQLDLRGLSEAEAADLRERVSRDLLEVLGADPDASEPLVPVEAAGEEPGGDA